MLKVIKNWTITGTLFSVSKTMHSELEEPPVESPRTHVEPSNGFPSTIDRWYGCPESDILHNVLYIYILKRSQPLQHPFRGCECELNQVVGTNCRLRIRWKAIDRPLNLFKLRILSAKCHENVTI